MLVNIGWRWKDTDSRSVAVRARPASVQDERRRPGRSDMRRRHADGGGGRGRRGRAAQPAEAGGRGGAGALARAARRRGAPRQPRRGSGRRRLQALQQTRNKSAPRTTDNSAPTDTAQPQINKSQQEGPRECREAWTDSQTHRRAMTRTTASVHYLPLLGGGAEPERRSPGGCTPVLIGDRIRAGQTGGHMRTGPGNRLRIRRILSCAR